MVTKAKVTFTGCYRISIVYNGYVAMELQMVAKALLCGCNSIPSVHRGIARLSLWNPDGCYGISVMVAMVHQCYVVARLLLWCSRWLLGRCSSMIIKDKVSTLTFVPNFGCKCKSFSFHLLVEQMNGLLTVLHFCTLYVRLARQLQKEVQSPNSQDFTEEQKVIWK